MSEESDLESDREQCEGIWGVDSVEDHGERVPPISVCVQLDGKEVAMELGTGASVSLMSENGYLFATLKRVKPSQNLTSVKHTSN